MKVKKQIELSVSGLGIIMYSSFAVKSIREGEDYLTSSYQSPGQVLSHIYKGSIIGFCTYSPGEYLLKICYGYPSQDELNKIQYKLRLGICVKGGEIFFRDLYDLLEWKSNCDIKQSFKLDDGFYHITLCTNIPASGVIGDFQEIYICLNQLDTMPELYYLGVPILCE